MAAIAHPPSGCRKGRCCRPAPRSSARQRHQLVGGETFPGKPSPQVLDDPCAAALLGPIGPNDLDGIAVIDEVDLRMRQKTGLLAYRLGNSDLAFRCDADRTLLTLTSKSKTDGLCDQGSP